jgi:hypothetical protein
MTNSVNPSVNPGRQRQACNGDVAKANTTLARCTGGQAVSVPPSGERTRYAVVLMLLPSGSPLRVKVGVDVLDSVADRSGCDVTLAVDDDVLAVVVAVVLDDDAALA